MDFSFSWEQIWGGVVTTVLAGLVKVVGTYLKEQKDIFVQEQKKKEEIIRILMKNNEEIMNWKNIMEADNKEIQQKLSEINSNMEKITNSDLILLKDRIIQLCRHAVNKGEITVSVRENVTEMYKCYQNMGGNGTGKIIYEQAMKLRISDLDSNGGVAI